VLSSSGNSTIRHSVHLLVSHLIFCPNYRRALLGGPLKKRREQSLHEMVHEHQWQLIELAIQPDQVHLCVRTLPSPLPSDIPRLIKERSSRLLHQEFAHVRRWPVLWSPSYSSQPQAMSAAGPSHDLFNSKASTKRFLPPPLPQRRNAHSSPS
jgi:putative transposase